MELPTLKYLDLSTAHITADDSQKLSDPDVFGEAGLSVYENDYGWFIPVSGYDDLVAKVQQAGMSEAFVELIRLCKAQGIELIRLDCDAPVIEGLPVFDW